LSRLARLDEAIAAYQEVVQLRPRMAIAWYNLAQALEDRDLRDRALGVLPQLGPGGAHSLAAAGAMSRGRTPRVHLCLTRAIDADERFSPAYVRLARILESENRPEVAVAVLRDLAQVDPVEGHLRLGDLYARQKRPDDMVREYEEVVRRRPDNPEVWYQVGL